MIPKVSQFLGKVGNYAGSVAREARDIPTAIGTAISTKNANYLRDVPTQVKEVGTTATTGYKGTTAFVKSKLPNSDFTVKTDRGRHSVGNQVSIGSGYKGKLPNTP